MDAHRRTLKQAYKLRFPSMGIYAVRNLHNGRVLLGQSANLPGALNRHRMELRLGCHRLQALQADWHAAGESAFSFESLETLAERSEPDFDYAAELDRRLAHWQRELAACGTPGYR